MDENKEYYCFDEVGGCIKISDSVVSSIAAKACLESEGIASLAGTQLGSEWTEIFAKKGSKGIKLTAGENNDCTIDIFAIIQYGMPITETAQRAQAAVKTAVEAATGLKVVEVNINIVGVAFSHNK